MELFDDIAKNRIMNMVIATYPKIEVIAGRCRYNFRCSYNVVHDAITDNQNKIAMCFYVEGGHPIIHFLNIDDDGNYVDNTLGHWATQYKYYLVRSIDKNSFFQVNDIFNAYRKELRKKLPFLIRLLSDCQF